MSEPRDAFRPSRIVTLTTDFGTRDAYVGAMKGVLLRIAPDLAVHDVSHEVPPQDVRHGARVLRGACPYFPAGTVHLAVVDPGVGTARAPIVAIAGGHAFVGPDNGLFGDVLATLGDASARRIVLGPALDPLLPEATSATFHGRDLFAPVAAGLASGRVRFADVGPEHALVRLAATGAERDASGGLRGRVTHHDRFGNAVTDVTRADIEAFGEAARIRLAEGTSVPLVRTYGDADVGTVVALIGSEGFLEVAVNGGSARETCRLDVGDEIRVETCS